MWYPPYWGGNVARYLNPPADTPFPLEYAFAMLGDVRGRRVLDFGCGSGENSLMLARRGARVVGVDISEPLIRLARRPGGRAIFDEPVRDSALLRAVRRCIPYRAPDVSPFDRPLTTRELLERFSAVRVMTLTK